VLGDDEETAAALGAAEEDVNLTKGKPRVPFISKKKNYF
jgi:hypothetical protein